MAFFESCGQLTCSLLGVVDKTAETQEMLILTINVLEHRMEL